MEFFERVDSPGLSAMIAPIGGIREMLKNDARTTSTTADDWLMRMKANFLASIDSGKHW